MNNLHIYLGVAVLLPLIAFFINLFLGHALRRNGQSKIAASISLAAIAGAALLSFVSLFLWLGADNHDGKTNRAALAELKQTNKKHLQHLEDVASEATDESTHTDHAHETHDEEGHDKHAPEDQTSILSSGEVFTAVLEEEQVAEGDKKHSD
ncbi:MAG: hypothetical protein VX776_08950, partial [Planctomycetota bacterium]|nr:hypothetical protein [Planctomycetota bacterium]